MQYDIFFSYSQEDFDRSRKIVAALREEGLKVWFDETNIITFESITQAIETGLAQSRAFLAYYSKAYPLRRACQWELTKAFLAAQQDGDQRRILVVNPEPNSLHIHPVELRDAAYHRDLATSSGVENLPSLVKAISRHLTGLLGKLGNIQALAPPLWLGMRGTGSTRFVGRLTDLWNIHSQLHAAQVAVITGVAGPSVAQVRGLGGIGKSLLAEEYALRFGSAFPGGIFWLRAYGNDDAKIGITSDEREAERDSQIRNFSESLGLPVQNKTAAEIEAGLGREIERRGAPCLWIVDDIPSGLDGLNLRRWLAPHPLAKTLVTTRSRAYSAIARSIDLGVLPDEDAYVLLTHRRKPQSDSEKEQAMLLIQDLGGHALAIDVAGALLARSEGLLTFEGFRAELAQKDEDALELAAALADVLPNGHNASIASTLLYSIRCATEEATAFLRLASLLAVAPIPVSVVSGILQTVKPLSDRASQERAIRAVTNAYSLSLCEEPESQRDTRTVHTLVARAIRFRSAESEDLKLIRNAAVTYLTSELSKGVGDPRLYSRPSLLLTHARELVSVGASLPEAQLLGLVAKYDQDRGAYKSATDAFHRQREILKNVLGADHPSTLAAMNNHAEMLREQGEIVRAREEYEELLKFREVKLGPRHADTLKTMTGLAATLWEQGEFVKAQNLYEHTSTALEQVLGCDHAETLEAKNGLAAALWALKDLARARQVYEEVLESRQRVVGPEHPETLQTLGGLAATVLGLKDYSEAASLYRHAAATSTRVLGDDHPLVFAMTLGYAAALRRQGNLGGAEERYRVALAGFARTLGPEHPDTLMAKHNVAEMLRLRGELEAARSLHQETLEHRRRVLGLEHPDTSISAWHFYQTLLALGAEAAAQSVLAEQLLWLLKRDRDTLVVQQIEIFELVAKASAAGDVS